MNFFNAIGLLGAFIGGYAYLPQIRHLIKEQCSAGISPRAYGLWTLSSGLLLINAISISSIVFVVLGFIQLSATFIILLFSNRNKGHVCATHVHGEDPLKNKLI